uniref:Uncharacterized protein n=1 Tax=Arundo donax TaxID=35708 RepID=A0A0A9E7E8_ARUDO
MFCLPSYLNNLIFVLPIPYVTNIVSTHFGNFLNFLHLLAAIILH